MPALTVDEVEAILEAEKSDALSAQNASDLSSQRSQAMDFYLGDMEDEMPHSPDRSGAVSSDVADTIEGMMPALMEIFASGDETVVFEPVGEEDEEAARQETDYINHVFMKKNAGFLVLYSFIKDALLSKNGIVKCWWDEEERVEIEEHKGLTDADLGMILGDESAEIEIIEQSDYPAYKEPDVREDEQS